MVSAVDAQTWKIENKVVAKDRGSMDQFGMRVDMDDNHAIVGVPFDDTYYHGKRIYQTGAAYIYGRDSTGRWIQVQQLTAPVITANHEFGYAVCIENGVAFVGAPFEEYRGKHAGAVYVFVLQSNGTWKQTQKITAAVRDQTWLLGRSLSMSGNYALVGASSGTEVVYVYKKDSSGFWSQTQTLVSSDIERGDNFGQNLDVSGDVAVIAAEHEDHDVNNQNHLHMAGSVYIFEKDGSGKWNEVQKIVASDRGEMDVFGRSVSVYDSVVVVGALSENHDEKGRNYKEASGSAYIYRQDKKGNWNEVQKIVASDRDELNFFGWGVSVHKKYILVGATGNDYDSNGADSMNYAGAYYVFQEDSNRVWQEIQKVTANDRRTESQFGRSVAQSSKYAIIGAFHDIYNEYGVGGVSWGGSAYLYSHCNSRSTLDTASCRSYTSPSGKYVWTTSGTYTDIMTNASGCDSIITINLTILKPEFVIDTAVCNTYVSPDGNEVWTVSGTYWDTIHSTTGCDTFFKVNLSVLSNSSDVHVQECEAYRSPSGKYTWTQSGQYEDTLLNSTNCDSVITIHLDILKSFSTFDTTSCRAFISPSGKYTWTASGTYKDTIRNTQNCDSVLTIGLTILETSSVVEEVVCSDYISPSGRYTWTKSGVYFDTIPNSNNCDSLITIRLQVLRTSSQIDTAVCYMYPSPSGKYVWSQTGSYRDTVLNSNNCDSVILVNLKINVTESELDSQSCFNMVSPSGKYVWVQSGVYADTLTNTTGCDSLITINLEIVEVERGLVQRNAQLVVLTSQPAEYQWLDCSFGYAPIRDSTRRSFKPVEQGTFAAEVIQSGCVDTTDCIDIVRGWASSMGQQIRVYPNPTTGWITIEIEGEPSIKSVNVYNAVGQRVYSEPQINAKQVNMEMFGDSGVYLFEIELNTGGVKRVKVVKHD